MRYEVKYLGKGEIFLNGVGNFGEKRMTLKAIDEHKKNTKEAIKNKTPLPHKPKPERVVNLLCSKKTAEKLRDEFSMEMKANPKKEPLFTVSGFPGVKPREIPVTANKGGVKNAG